MLKLPFTLPEGAIGFKASLPLVLITKSLRSPIELQANTYYLIRHHYPDLLHAVMGIYPDVPAVRHWLGTEGD